MINKLKAIWGLLRHKKFIITLWNDGGALTMIEIDKEHKIIYLDFSKQPATTLEKIADILNTAIFNAKQ